MSKLMVMNCLHWLRTKSKLESHKNVCKNEDFCNVIIRSEDTEILTNIINLIEHLLLFMKILNL